MKFRWVGAGEINSRDFTCGWCGRHVASNRGWEATEDVSYHTDTVAASVVVCHLCTLPTVYIPRAVGHHPETQVPAPMPGREVDYLPPLVDGIYREARRACGVGAWTAAAMALRAVIAYVADDRGAPKSTFKGYVEWLNTNGFVPPGGEVWVGRIKDTGNDAAHDLELLSREAVTMVLDFTELLLRFVYEAPARMAADAARLEDATE